MRPGAAVTINYDMRYDIAGPAHDRPGASRGWRTLVADR